MKRGDTHIYRSRQSAGKHRARKYFPLCTGATHKVPYQPPSPRWGHPQEVRRLLPPAQHRHRAGVVQAGPENQTNPFRKSQGFLGFLSFPSELVSLTFLLQNSCFLPTSWNPKDLAEMSSPRPDHRRENLASFTGNRVPLKQLSFLPASSAPLRQWGVGGGEWGIGDGEWGSGWGVGEQASEVLAASLSHFLRGLRGT